MDRLTRVSEWLVSSKGRLLNPPTGTSADEIGVRLSSRPLGTRAQGAGPQGIEDR
jgi:hypothetical protein